MIPVPTAHAQAPPNGVEATSTPLDAPAGLAYDAAGNLYIASLGQNVIRKVDLNGIITTVAGTGDQGFAGDGGLATSAILDSPEGVAVDAAGNIYISDTQNNRIRKVTAATGIITTIAGTGVADFSGDGGLATAATLSSPQALAVDAAGNLYIADTDNNRIRKLTGTTISTVAGNGDQLFAGDGGLATAASLDSPAGLAVDAGNNLYIADTHNNRIRKVTASTGIITTFAGDGTGAYSGDAGAATSASLDRPTGLAIDSSGRLYIADSNNNRIRVVSSTGTISTLAGTGAQGFGGDTGLAADAILDTPNSVAVFGSSIAFTDSNNSRARAVAANGTIGTVAGIGATGTATLVLSGPTTVVYGTGTLTATFDNGGSTATGTVTLLEGTTARGTGTLSGNTATITLPALSAGIHTLAATYPGDGSNPATASGNYVLTVTPAPLTASANAASVAYGLPIPTLTGTLTGVRPADAANVTAVFATTATQGSSTGTYPITVSLTGSAAANYSVPSATSAVVTITPAATRTTLTVDTNPAYAGVAFRLTATVSAATAGTTGTPTGTVNFFNGTAQIGTNVALVNGVASVTATLSTVGSQQLSAVYVPSATPRNWTASTSNTVSETILPGTDFALAVTTASQTVIPGQSVSYTINVTPNPTPFTAPITFTVSGLPVGATATFAPASVTPGSSAASTVMTVKTAPLASMLRTGSGIGVAFTLLLLPLASRNRRRSMTRLTATVLLCLGSLGAATFLSGCGATNGFFGQSAKDYTLTITGTSTGVTGAPLVHTTTVTLNLQ